MMWLSQKGTWKRVISCWRFGQKVRLRKEELGRLRVDEKNADKVEMTPFKADEKKVCLGKCGEGYEISQFEEGGNHCSTQ